MKVTSEKIDNHTTVLNVEVPQPELAKALERAYQKIAGKVNIPGFRKGKAPRKIIEARLGKGVLLEDAFDIIAPEAYTKALEQESIDPVSPPKIEVVTLVEDQPLVFKATVVGKPTVVLGQYKELSVEKSAPVVSDEDVDSELEKVRERHARMVVSEEGTPIEKGDMAIIDFIGFIDDTPFPGGQGEGYPLRIGSGSFIPGFEDQLIGAKANEEREVLVTFPEEYQEKSLAGKEAKFAVKIHDVKRRELPALDDDFAKELGDFETMAEYKNNLRAGLEDTAQKRAEQDYLNALVQAATDNASFEVPDIMVENQLDGIIESMDFNFKMRGINLEAYLAYSKMTLEELRNQHRAAALQEVRYELTLSAIAKEENLTVTEEDLRAEAEEMAAAYGTTAEDILKASVKTNRTQALENTVLRKKAAKLISDNAVA